MVEGEGEGEECTDSEQGTANFLISVGSIQFLMAVSVCTLIESVSCPIDQSSFFQPLSTFQTVKIMRIQLFSKL